MADAGVVRVSLELPAGTIPVRMRISRYHHHMLANLALLEGKRVHQVVEEAIAAYVAQKDGQATRSSSAQ